MFGLKNFLLKLNFGVCEFLNQKHTCAPRGLFSVRVRVRSVAKSGDSRPSPAIIAARRASYQPRPRGTETDNAADMATTRMD